jgi:AcrR family transcriptional regulator
VRAALEAVAEGGLGAVVVERLALRVGASKGSFYWHFADRAALIDAVLKAWEETRTDAIIETLESVADPRERLRRLFAIAFGDLQAGRVEAALIAEANDAQISSVVRRVKRRRVAYLTDAFRELGFDARQAEQRAVVAYGTYVGLFVVGAENPDAVPARGQPLDAFADELVELLTQL